MEIKCCVNIDNTQQQQCYNYCMEVSCMQQKKLAKVNPFPDYIRESDPNMELLSAYTILAKGEDRSLNDFAKDCGVSTSTLSRLINKKNNKKYNRKSISHRKNICCCFMTQRGITYNHSCQKCSKCK